VVNANRVAARRLLGRLGIGDTDMTALEHLFANGPLGPVELGEKLGLRSASATALVDRLEAAGTSSAGRTRPIAAGSS
jgi:DNA-binding MarR family transcriptional regulator